MATNTTDPPVGDGPFPDYPGVDHKSCSLLGPTALVVQALMGVFVILSLIFKRHREKPKRPWRIWLFDVSKQVVGQMFVHGVNVLISDLVATHSAGNACVGYFLNILIDTTLGVAIIYLILHVLTWLMSEKLHLKGFESGQYGNPPSIKYWLRQAAIYVLSLTSMKLLVIGLFALYPGLFKIGEWLLSWTRTSDDKEYLQVIFTMGIFPITMNVLQFWLIDSIVKASEQEGIGLPTDSPRNSYENRADREPLFNAPSDDEDDDGPGMRHDIENPPIRTKSQERDPKLDSPDDKGSGASTPGPLVEGPQAVAMHAYPPSITSSAASSYTRASSSTSPSHSRHPSTSPSPKSLRKTKPPPLALRQSQHPAVDPAPKPQPAPPPPAPEQDDWAQSWDDSDDWANKVGEEEWTGRRMEEKKDAVDEVWGNHASDSAAAVKPAS